MVQPSPEGLVLSRPTKVLDDVALGFLTTCINEGVGVAVAAWALSSMRLDLATTSERMRDLLVSREYVRIEMNRLRDDMAAVGPTENGTDRKPVEHTKNGHKQETGAEVEVGSTEGQAASKEGL